MWALPPHKLALDYMWYAGELATSRRINFNKYYDLADRIFPESLRELNVPDQDQIDCVGFLRDTALSHLDDTDSPQFRTYHADNIKDVSKLDKAPVEVLQLLDQNENLTPSVVAKIGTLAEEFLIGLDQKDMRSLSD